MISEKSVELNTTAELLGWLQYVTGITHTAIGPSLQEEAVLGYDVSFHGGGTAAALIQYKRAYVAGTVWTWRLNRTKRQDQHRRLQSLESSGYPVFYAFPHFATPAELVAFRRQLLVQTSWYPPSYIQPPGGPSGHHEVTYDATTRQWQVSSPESVNLRPPLTIDDVIRAMEAQAERRVSIEEFAVAINRAMFGVDPRSDELDLGAQTDFSGQSLLLRHQT